MENLIPIHESKTSEKVVKFIDLDNFTESFKEEFNNCNVYGCYFDKDGNIVYDDNSGNTNENIIKS